MTAKLTRRKFLISSSLATSAFWIARTSPGFGQETVAALKSGRHVYCEKPLTHTVSECRIVRETARKQKRVTQMGTQIHAGNNYRRVVELIQSGAIGGVREIHTWVGASYGGKHRPT